MNTETTKQQTAADAAKKPGMFTRLLGRLDQAMKEKAEVKAREGCGCGPSDKKGAKGGKCC